MKEFFKYVLATIVGVLALSLIGTFLMFIIFGAIIASADKQVTVADQSMLVIDLNQSIVDRASNDPFEDIELPGFLSSVKTIGLDHISESLKKAVDDDRIKGIYLKLSTTNGGFASVEEIRNDLIAFKDSCDKPIYACADQMLLDQKGYYLATVADQIVLHPEVTLDFRGLGSELMFYKNALDKLGVEMQIIRGPNNKFKSAVEPFMLEEMSEASREQRLLYMNSLWNHMLNGISEARGISVEQLNVLADEAQTYKKAIEMVENGLIDAAKYRDEVLNDMREITGIEGTDAIPVVSVKDYAKVPVKGQSKKYSRNKVAVIYASGEIGVALSGDEGISGDKLGKEIRKARQDSSYKAIVLRVNSPGGAVFDSETIWREVKLAAEEKTLVVSFGDVAASGGYYISCPADKIVASPNTITGSIGIFGQIPNFGELMNDKLGITTDAVGTNEHSNFVSLMRPMTPYEKQRMTHYISIGYDTFLSHVADGRGMTKEAVDNIGQGRVWSGENAMEIGLIDEFGGLEHAIQLAVEMEGLEDYRTVSLPALKSPFEEMFKLGGNVKARILKGELGDTYRYYEHLKKATEMNGIYARMPYDIYLN
ncbi:signal peptide peptidase SppA [Draconibacterium halophilum]|uniref:Signal peptide peptidase SppA n=1 Tax=Draconibacterium halophilum TaxID=2706887 RepID=A0A6C0RAM5_9BACT|nr:signal peptide peptidase SppA [Draconibacterium halophilum]QIA07137.1 signal peptide peptidase SppA [Draconibacterium halophilum]